MIFCVKTKQRPSCFLLQARKPCQGLAAGIISQARKPSPQEGSLVLNAGTEVEAGEETTVTEGPVPGSPVVRTLDGGTDPTHGWTTKMPQAASWEKKITGRISEIEECEEEDKSDPINKKSKTS